MGPEFFWDPDYFRDPKYQDPNSKLECGPAQPQLVIVLKKVYMFSLHLSTSGIEGSGIFGLIRPRSERYFQPRHAASEEFSKEITNT